MLAISMYRAKALEDYLIVNESSEFLNLSKKPATEFTAKLIESETSVPYAVLMNLKARAMLKSHSNPSMSVTEIIEVVRNPLSQ